ncbi:hypothetical protein B0H10DRAFT_2236585 [Mycena sp. CBHHK59/15]|nr:hypothetical protein B0H10DRAFT_2236585 [Mycena sp. CBHHK59/15]
MTTARHTSPARLDYAHLNTTFRILAREHPARSPEQPVLIAAHTARYLEAHAGGGLALDLGPFVATLEHAARVKAHVIGNALRTGKYRPGDESRANADDGAPPDEVCATFADFVDGLLGVE